MPNPRTLPARAAPGDADAIPGCPVGVSRPAPGEAGIGSSSRRGGRSAVAETPPGRRPHILATEDDPGIRALLCDLLTEEGYQVSLSSAQDVAEVRRLAPDVILLDYWITGGAFLERLKADPATASVPVLVLTGAKREVTEQAARLAALDVAVLLKPFDIEALLGEVRRRLAGAPTRPRRQAVAIEVLADDVDARLVQAGVDRAEQDERDSAPALAQAADEGEAVQAGHHDVR